MKIPVSAVTVDSFFSSCSCFVVFIVVGVDLDRFLGGKNYDLFFILPTSGSPFSRKVLTVKVMREDNLMEILINYIVLYVLYELYILMSTIILRLVIFLFFNFTLLFTLSRLPLSEIIIRVRVMLEDDPRKNHNKPRSDSNLAIENNNKYNYSSNSSNSSGKSLLPSESKESESSKKNGTRNEAVSEKTLIGEQDNGVKEEEVYGFQLIINDIITAVERKLNPLTDTTDFGPSIPDLGSAIPEKDLAPTVPTDLEPVAAENKEDLGSKSASSSVFLKESVSSHQYLIVINQY